MEKVELYRDGEFYTCIKIKKKDVSSIFRRYNFIDRFLIDSKNILNLSDDEVAGYIFGDIGNILDDDSLQKSDKPYCWFLSSKMVQDCYKEFGDMFICDLSDVIKILSKNQQMKATRGQWNDRDRFIQFSSYYNTYKKKYDKNDVLINNLFIKKYFILKQGKSIISQNWQPTNNDIFSKDWIILK